jgi:predicted secreted hydrolase
MKRSVAIITAILILLLLLGGAVLFLRQPEPGVQARLVAQAEEPNGFRRAAEPAALAFPLDHGPHPDYQTEWWYYTGNVQTPSGRHFGYQLTFFRRALVPPGLRQDRDSAWAADQVYMAHFALTDVAGNSHQAFERFSRGAAGLAGAQAVPYRVWLDDWSVQEINPGIVHLQAAQGDLGLDLLLADQKGPILQGDQGYSQKGPDPGNASYYYSLTRLETSGVIQVADGRHEVTGLSWMDHEYSTSSLAADQVGWDWFSLQLEDDSELMVFQLRREDGTEDPFSSGTFVAADGSTRTLEHDAFEIRVEETWRSPRTGATYPAQWTIIVPDMDLTLRVEPRLADQELNLSYAYWEGAVRIQGMHAGQTVRGDGYVELTGYASSMQGQF